LQFTPDLTVNVLNIYEFMKSDDDFLNHSLIVFYNVLENENVLNSIITCSVPVSRAAVFIKLTSLEYDSNPKRIHVYFRLRVGKSEKRVK